MQKCVPCPNESGIPSSREISSDGASGELHGAVVSRKLPQGERYKGGILFECCELVGMLQQGEQSIAEQVASSFMTRHE
jgi:hypothetical protein